MGELALSMAFTLLGIIILIASYSIKINAGEVSLAITSGAFPKLVSFFMIAFSLLNTLSVLKKARKAALQKTVAVDNDNKPSIPFRNTSAFGVLLTLGLCVGYFLLFEALPFMLSSTLFMAGFLFAFRRDKPLANIVTAVLFSFGIYAMFSLGFEVMLPVGADVFNLSNMTGQ